MLPHNTWDGQDSSECEDVEGARLLAKETSLAPRQMAEGQPPDGLFKYE